MLASLLERNLSEVAAQQEWEAEWNTHGLTSRLSEEVRERERVIGTFCFNFEGSSWERCSLAFPH